MSDFVIGMSFRGCPLTAAAVTIDDAMSSPAKSTVNPAPTHDAADTVQPAASIAHIKATNINLSSDDVTMDDAPTVAQKPTNNKNLPPWLLPMIKYLCGVAVDTAWQNLVTKLIKFEKGGLPAGVCFTFIYFHS